MIYRVIRAAPASTPAPLFRGSAVCAVMGCVNNHRKDSEFCDDHERGEVAIPDTPPGVEWKPTIAGGSMPDRGEPRDAIREWLWHEQENSMRDFAHLIETYHEDLTDLIVDAVARFRAVPPPAETQGKE